MNEPILSVKFFHTEAGNEPVRDFLRELPPEDRKIIGTDIKEVQFGWRPNGVASCFYQEITEDTPTRFRDSKGP